MGPRWRYLAGELGIGLRRNLLMTFAMVITVTVCLTLLGTGLLIQRQVDVARDLFFADVEVSIFLQDGIPASQRASLEEELSQNPLVESVIYESQEDAFEHFQEMFADDPTMLEAVTPEILPASFRVSLTDPEQFAVIASQFSGYPGVDQVQDQREVLDRFFVIMNGVRWIAVGIAVLQGVGAAALIWNTVRMNAFARREQTAIMKLVGATNWYIRLPFILEGVIAGVIGALFAGALLVLGSELVLDGLRGRMVFMPIVGTRDVLLAVPALVVIGALIAAVSSFLSLRRFLSV